MKKQKILIILTVVVIIGFTGLGKADSSDGLVACYPFNGNSDDESGNGNHGVVHGVTLTTDRYGNTNS